MSKVIPNDIQDSTDWLETPLPSLAPLDAALRCQVCKDFYDTPMITSCSHTFCSKCIRRALSSDGKCPGCRAQDQEMKLRFNAAMEELVGAFKIARPQVMEFATKPVPDLRSASPKRVRGKEAYEDDGSPPRKRTRASQRSSQRGSQPSTRIVVIDSDQDEDFVPEDGCVECPICNRRVKEDLINSHIDRGCPDEARITTRATKPTFGSSTKVVEQEKPVKKLDRLPAINISMYKDTQLKKKMVDLGISAAGSRQAMEKRYTEWTILWNANCDATKPKTKLELKRELDSWERAQNAKPSGSNFGHQIKDKDFDGQDWSNTHDSTFKDLIAKARQKVARKKEAPEAASSSSEPTPLANPQASASTVEQDTPMTDSNDHTPDASENPAPALPENSGRRFFQEKEIDIIPSSQSPPSSQCSRKVSVLNNDASILADAPTIRSL